MGEFKAAKWISGLFIYFIFLILIVSIVESEANNYDSDVDSYYDYSKLVNDYVCGSPRFKYDVATGERSKLPRASEGQLNCEESKGILNSVDCNSINGCEWENVTSGFWWWTTTVEQCSGNINTTEYGIEMFQPVIGRPRVKKHNSTFYEQDNTRSACKHDQVVFNSTLCDYFSCSWEKYDIAQNINNPSDVISTIGDIFSFRYDFGIENSAIAWLVRMLFVILPLLMLIIAIYYMLPIIN